MPGVLAEGEYSLFLFGGRYSHAIVKRPAAGDFRVQPQFGGREELWDARTAARDLAEAALAAVPAPTVYARFAMIGDGNGSVAIMESEARQTVAKGNTVYTRVITGGRHR